MVAVSLHLLYSLSSQVRLFLSLSFFWRARVELLRSVIVSVCALKKPGGGNNTHSVFEVFFNADVHFEAKPIEVV